MTEAQMARVYEEQSMSDARIVDEAQPNRRTPMLGKTHYATLSFSVYAEDQKRAEQIAKQIGAGISHPEVGLVCVHEVERAFEGDPSLLVDDDDYTGDEPGNTFKDADVPFAANN